DERCYFGSVGALGAKAKVDQTGGEKSKSETPGAGTAQADVD
ncbi:hypothetical protein GCK32_012258, partial [Trichostrongylus colubriformis]